jgi:drug/metabolite transporter (DMT)-like permease
MSALLLSICCSVLIVVIFKYFVRYRVQTFPAIVINYWVCVLVGSLMSGQNPFTAESLGVSWFPWTIGLGLLFITGFYSIGVTVQLFGLALASIMQKMSLLLSVPFALFFFEEPLSLSKGLGLVLALLAVFLANAQDPPLSDTELLEEPSPKKGWWLLFPIYVFFNSGSIEALLQYAQGVLIRPEESALFTMLPFGIAGFVGTLVSLALLCSGKIGFGLRELIAGIVLGIPNYFSIFFLIEAMKAYDKSVVIPSANIAVVGLSAILGIILFRERLNSKNRLGLLLALGAIALISL